MSQADDITAIDAMFHSVERKTSKANDLFNDWVNWYTNLSWYNKNLDQQTFDTARNMRNAFNLANATTAEETNFVKQSMTGFTAETVDRRDSAGNYPKPVTPSFGTKLSDYWSKLSWPTKIVSGIVGIVIVKETIRKI